MGLPGVPFFVLAHYSGIAESDRLFEPFSPEDESMT